MIESIAINNCINSLNWRFKMTNDLSSCQRIFWWCHDKVKLWYKLSFFDIYIFFLFFTFLHCRISPSLFRVFFFCSMKSSHEQLRRYQLQWVRVREGEDWFCEWGKKEIVREWESESERDFYICASSFL